jgi:ribosomal protein S27AE
MNEQACSLRPPLIEADTYRRKGMYKEAVDAVIKLNEVTNNQREIAALRKACSQCGNRGALHAVHYH